MAETETERPPLRCEFCDYTTQWPIALSQHRKGHPEVQAATPPAQPVLAETNGSGGEEKKSGFLSRLWAPKEPKPPKPPKPPREVKPGTRRGRVSVATLAGVPIDFAAELAPAVGLPATGKMLAIEAPWAGYVIDEAVAGTVIDRLAQPLAKAQDRFAAVGSVIGPPLIVAQMERNPDRIPVLAVMLKRSLKMSAPWIAKGIKKMREEEAKLAEVLAELYPTAPPGTTALDQMVADIVALAVTPKYHPPQEPRTERTEEESDVTS